MGHFISIQLPYNKQVKMSIHIAIPSNLNYWGPFEPLLKPQSKSHPGAIPSCPLQEQEDGLPAHPYCVLLGVLLYGETSLLCPKLLNQKTSAKCQQWMQYFLLLEI